MMNIKTYISLFLFMSIFINVSHAGVDDIAKYYEMKSSDLTKEETLKELIELSNRGDAKSQSEYATYLHVNSESEEEFKKAYFLHIKAANNGSLESSFQLGRFFYDDTEVKRNCEKAVYWLNYGAKNGQEASMAWLALLYSTGDACPANPLEAFKLYNNLCRTIRDHYYCKQENELWTVLNKKQKSSAAEYVKSVRDGVVKP